MRSPYPDQTIQKFQLEAGQPRNIRLDPYEVLVFDANTTQLLATLRTATTPSMMGFTIDQKFLLVGNNDSQLVNMYDLDALKAVQPIVLPGGHYGRSIAASNAKLLVLARNELGSVPATIDTVTLGGYSASALASLGDYKNSVSATSVLSPSPNGATIMMASPDGNVMLYSAASDNFTVSRKDLTALSGAFASSAYNTYVIGNTVFNASLVPQSTLSTSTGATASGFYFLNQGGYLVTATTASGPGTIQNLSSLQTTTVKATAMVEAPLLPSASSTSSSSSSSSSTGSGSRLMKALPWPIANRRPPLPQSLIFPMSLVPETGLEPEPVYGMVAFSDHAVPSYRTSCP